MTSPTPALRATVRRARGRTVLVLEGELDLATRDEVRSCLREIAAGRAGRVVVDLAGVTFADAAGVGALLAGKRAVDAAGGTLVLASPSRLVRRVLRLLQLEDALPVEG